MRVAVLDDWQGVAEGLADWPTLRRRAEVVFFHDSISDAAAVVRALAGFEVVLAMRERTPFPAAVLRALPALRLLAFTGPRNAAVDVAAATEAGIVVCNTVSRRTSHGTAELALALLLACARRLPAGDAAIRAGGFQEAVPLGCELAGRTLGLAGLGRIGGRMARYGQALDMRVLAWSQNLTDARAAEVGAERVEKARLFAEADAVSLHLVLSERTRGVVGAAEIAGMKPDAILVNTSRAPLIERAPLLAALGEGRIIAGLDVFDTEPLRPDDALRSAPNTVLTPHIGYVTGENMAELYGASVENILAWLDGAPIRVINPDVVPKA